MATVRWIKMTTDLFDNRKIKQIEALPDGDKLIVIWVKLLCLAGNINDCGLVYFTKEIPYTEQMLATQFNKPLATIQLAIRIFQEFGMVEIVDDILKISNWEKYQNVEGMEKIRAQTRERVARCRENKKLSLDSQCNATCNATVTQGNATDKDIDKDIDIDIYNNKLNNKYYLSNISKCNSKGATCVTPTPKKQTMFELFEQYIGGYEIDRPLADELRIWIKYKSERKEKYTETGLKSMLRQMENKLKEYSSQQIIDLIEICMSQNYKGIIFDKLKNGGASGGLTRRNETKVTQRDENRETFEQLYRKHQDMSNMQE